MRFRKVIIKKKLMIRFFFIEVLRYFFFEVPRESGSVFKVFFVGFLEKG